MTLTSSEFRHPAQRAMFTTYKTNDMGLYKLRKASEARPKFLEYVRHVSLKGYPRRVSQMSALTSLRCITSVYFREMPWLEFVQLWNTWENVKEFRCQQLWADEDDWIVQDLQDRPIRHLAIEVCKNSTAFYKIIAASKNLRILRIPFREEWEERVPQSFIENVGTNLEVLEMYGDIKARGRPLGPEKTLLHLLSTTNKNIREATYWGHWSVGFPLYRVPNLESFSLVLAVNWCTMYDLGYAIRLSGDKLKKMHIVLFELRFSSIFGPHWNYDKTLYVLHAAKESKISVRLEILGGMESMGGSFDFENQTMHFDWEGQRTETTNRILNDDGNDSDDSGPRGPLFADDVSENGTIVYHDATVDDDLISNMQSSASNIAMDASTMSDASSSEQSTREQFHDIRNQGRSSRGQNHRALVRNVGYLASLRRSVACSIM